MVVELGNPVSQTAAGRFELSMQLVQMGVIKTPAEVLEVLETGRLEPLVKGTQEELVNILKENQDMVRGETPVVLLSDMFDVIPLDDCQTLFECVAQNVATWKEELFFTPVKNQILRICNGRKRNLHRRDYQMY